jgi:hypothetical protein
MASSSSGETNFVRSLVCCHSFNRGAKEETNVRTLPTADSYYSSLFGRVFDVISLAEMDKDRVGMDELSWHERQRSEGNLAQVLHVQLHGPETHRLDSDAPEHPIEARL